MARKKIPQQLKVRSELQKEQRNLCANCSNSDVGHFQIHHIDSNPANNVRANLILLCPTCHSKATKGSISIAYVQALKVNITKATLELS